MSNNSVRTVLNRNDEEFFEEISTLKGGGDMEWQHEYIRNLNDDVRAIRSETQKMRQDFHNKLNAMRSEINQTLDSKINSFLAEMRDRDNQRHKEMLAMQNNIAGLRNEMTSTRKWIIGLVVAGSISFLGIAVSVAFGVFNVVNALVK